MKAILAVISVGLALTMWATAASAGAPLGPAMATLEQGDLSLGFEFAQETMTLSADGPCIESVSGSTDSYKQKFEIDDLESTMYFARLTYGLTDQWDVFLRLGAADAQDDLNLRGGTGLLTGTGAGTIAMDGNHGFAYGVGTRATFWNDGPWSIAGTAQATWFNPGDTSFNITRPATPDQSVLGEAQIDYLQTQFSLALVYQEDPWGVWIGPFAQLIDGDLDLDADFVVSGSTLGNISCAGDIEEESVIGLHAGAALAVAPGLAGWVEAQYTPDSWLFGLGAVIRPK